MAYRRGPNGDATNRFLAINYSTNGSDQLFRSYGSVDYSQNNFLTVAYATNTPSYPLASHILGVEALAVTETTNYPLTTNPEANWATNHYNSTNSTPDFNALITTKPNFASGLTNRTYAMQIWIAAVDEQNYSLLTHNSDFYGKVKDALSGDPIGWRDQIDSNRNIPSTIKSGIRILSKTITLP